MYCEHCGKKISSENASFCGYCGQPVRGSSEDLIGEDAMSFDEITEEQPAHSPQFKLKIMMALIGAIAGIALVAVLLIQLIPLLKEQNDPILTVEDGALVYYDGLSDEEGITVDADYGVFGDFNEVDATEAAYRSCEAQFSEDGNYLYYLADRDLMQIDLKALQKKGRREATTRIASDISDFSVYGDKVVYTTCFSFEFWGFGAYAYVPEEERGNDFIGYYDVSENQTYTITNYPYSPATIAPGGCAVSEDGKYILYGEDNSVYLYNTSTHSVDTVARGAVVYHCSRDLRNIVYESDGKVYSVTLENGEVEDSECIFELSQDDVEVKYADNTMVLYSGEDYDGTEITGIYKDGITTTYREANTMTFLIPLNWSNNLTSDIKYPLSELGESELWGVKLQRDKTYMIDSNFQLYETSFVAEYINSFAWDDDHSILYVCFEVYDEDADTDSYYSNELYAFTMENGTIIDETHIATNCYDRICYAPASQSLFYYDDYDVMNGCGTLCAIVYGEFRYELVENAYAEYDSLEGLQFNTTNSYILCWADVSDRVGTLYALDMEAPDPVTTLGTHVNMDSWGVYDGKILYIDNYSPKYGGTLCSFDGSSVERERENVMAVITDCTRYTYLED